ncbi:MAG: nucleotidyltransferase domain-containing protein [Actinomycetota bacterium]
MVSPTSAEEALLRLSPEERRWIEAFRDRVHEMLGPRLRDLRLFGSQVRGDAGPESDIDLLVLVEDGNWETAEAVVDLAASISSRLSARVQDFERYHSPRSRASGFYQEMRKESVRL